MKTLLLLIIMILSYKGNEISTREIGNLYPMTTVVTNVDYSTDTVTLTDFNGFNWRFTGTEDWDNGDICSCIMSDSGTPYIFDDEIITVKYDGWISGYPR